MNSLILGCRIASVQVEARRQSPKPSCARSTDPSLSLVVADRPRSIGEDPGERPSPGPARLDRRSAEGLAELLPRLNRRQHADRNDQVISTRRTVGLQVDLEVLPDLVGLQLANRVDEARRVEVMRGVRANQQLERMNRLVKLNSGVDETTDSFVETPGWNSWQREEVGEALDHTISRLVPQFDKAGEVPEEGRPGHACPVRHLFRRR